MKSTPANIILGVSNIKAQFLAEIEFGMPSRKCKNYGICNINPIRSEELSQRKNKAKAVALITLYNAEHVEFDFAKAYLSSADHEKFFKKETFLVNEDYVFEQDEKIPSEFTVKKGSYKILESRTSIKVICRYPTFLENWLSDMKSLENE